jgi:uncharacterized protein YbaA (DUF1428 family)
MAYVDGFVLAVPKARLEDYKRLAQEAASVWREHGALSYLEAVAEDVPYGELTSFPRAVMAKEDETVVFAFITYNSRAHRDEVNKKAMADPRLAGHNPQDMPFDTKRMIWGGFETMVER